MFSVVLAVAMTCPAQYPPPVAYQARITRGPVFVMPNRYHYYYHPGSYYPSYYNYSGYGYSGYNNYHVYSREPSDIFARRELYREKYWPGRD